MTTKSIDYQALLKNAYAALEDMQKRLRAVERARHEAIAIIGMGCRYPGEADNPDAFWRLLKAGTDAVTEVPPGRWDVEAYFDPDPDTPGKYYTRWGGFLKEVDGFDATFFRISPREAIKLDPQQRLLLEVSWEALEDAGCASPELAGSLTGVFVGMNSHDYFALQVQGQDPGNLDAYFSTGVTHSVAAGRISYFMDLHGPNTSIDTACSSSLVATHLACQSLRNNECDLALAGGVNLILAPDGMITTSRARMMAFDGRCKTFDASADGYVRGEGCGMMVLKRLPDALRDGDRILAVIEGTAMNHDGRSNGLTAPNVQAQEAVIRQALADAGISPRDVTLIEAHGTGTSLGDPIEMRALNTVYGVEHSPEDPFYVGSVKTNVGHLEGAAGIAGLMKLVLALQHKEIPPHLHFKTPNPLIPWDEIPVKIPVECIPWEVPAGKRRIAAVSSFGFSGTNVHVVVSEAPQVELKPASDDRPAHVLALSAKNQAALQDLARRYRDYLAGEPGGGLADVCFTANTGRHHFEERLALVASTAAEAEGKLAGWLGGEAPAGVFQGSMQGDDVPEVAFLFTGQGAQYTGMGRQLYETEPVFRQALDECDEILRRWLDKPLLSVLYPQNGEDGALIDQTGYTQPALFAIEYALAQLWASWGIEPGVVMGHSVGEYAAACIAGVFTLEDGLKLIAARGRLMQSLPPGGAMAAIFASEEIVAEAIEPYRQQVSIGAINGPANTVISGAGVAVQAIVEDLATKGIKSKPLTVSHAFHSPLMDPILDEFAGVASGVSYQPPQTILVSNLTGKPVEGDEARSAGYWREHVRRPVRFSDSMVALHEMGYRVFLEIGPQPTLLGMGRRCLPEAEALWLPSLRSGREDWSQMLESLANLFTAGGEVDWKGFDRRFPRRKLSLPTYPFQRQPYRVNAPSAPSPARREEPGRHPFLQRKLRSPRLEGTAYETGLSTKWLAYLNDHRFFGAPLFPATGYLELGLAACREALRTEEVALEELSIQEPLILPEEGERLVQVLVDPEGDGRLRFEVYSAREGDGEPWTLHCAGLAASRPADTQPPERADLEQIQGRCTQQVEPEDYYRQTAQLGAEYGPLFRGIEALWRREGEALGRISLPQSLAGQAGLYHLHPVLLDSCFQILGAVFPGYGKEDGGSTLYVPVGLQSYQVLQAGRPQLWAQAQLRSQADSAIEEAFTADIHLFTEDGEPVAEILGLQFRKVSRSAIWKAAQRRFDDWLYTLDWKPAPLAETPGALEPGGLWLIFADRMGVGECLAEALREQGGTAVLVYAANSTLPGPEGTWSHNPDSAEEFTRLLAEIGDRHVEPLRGAIHLWGLDTSWLQEPAFQPDRMKFGTGSALHLAQALARWAESRGLQDQAARLWVVTRGAQPVGSGIVDPVQSALWGLGSAIALEHPELRPALVDLDGEQAADLAGALLREIHASNGEDRIAWRGPERFTARLARLREAHSPVPMDNRPFELHVPERGILDRLTFHPVEHREPGPGEVELRVRATGLNFRDVLNVMGMYPGDPGPVGSECAGVVVRTDPGVTGISVGDEVIAFVPGAFASHAITSADLVLPKPAWMSFAEAVTIPIAFLTAHYGLHHLAKIKPGDRVLIHAAAGGVGLAAVQIAQQAGAQVFATAGSPRKHAYLHSLGVEHVLSSRTLDFAREIMELTGGRGVDIVLNSLADEFIPKSLSILADHGRFLEIGKRGIWDTQQVKALNPTLEYYVYDLGEVMQADAGFLKTAFAELMQEFEAGRLRPLPLRAFPIQQVVEAFRYMAQARHIGKVVVTQPSTWPEASVHADATYLVTGGLGGLGLVTTRSLIESGAKHLVLVGRSQPSDFASQEIAAWKEAGVNVTVARADVTQKEDLQQLLERIAHEMPPLRGVIHAAGVIDDGILQQQTWERFETVLAPKAAGAWLLHSLTHNLDLDFFILFSSMASILGASGQSNYAAANAYLDALAHYRRAQGLSATSINWGPWSEVGMAAGLGEREHRRWREQGVGYIAPEEGAQVFRQLLEKDLAQVSVYPVDWKKLSTRVSAQEVQPLLRELVSQNAAAQREGQAQEGQNFLQALESAEPEDRFERLMEHVQEQVIRVLGLDASQSIDPYRGLTDLGMDSLMAVELSNRLKRSMGHKLPTTVAFEYPTIAALTEYLAKDVLGLSLVSEIKSAESSGEDELMAELEQMSEEEVEASLLKELDDIGF